MTSKPCAGLQSITNLAKSEITALTNSDTYVPAVFQCLYQLNQLLTVSIFFITKPGAGLQSITNLAKSEITAFTNIDMVIICGGYNDVNRDMSHIGLNSLEKFGNLKTNTVKPV